MEYLYLNIGKGTRNNYVLVSPTIKSQINIWSNIFIWDTGYWLKYYGCRSEGALVDKTPLKSSDFYFYNAKNFQSFGSRSIDLDHPATN